MIRLGGLLVASLGLASCFVGGEGPPFATEAQVRAALKACKISDAPVERNADSGQFEVTIYDDGTSSAVEARKCLEEQMQKEAISFATWNIPVEQRN